LYYERKYNEVHDVADISDYSGEITEPVTVEEVKNFMRLEGFRSDVVESGELDFDFDDLLIAELITSAREGLEIWCGISIVRHKWRVLFTNRIGNIELPYSNNATIVSLSNCENEEILAENYTMRGTTFKYLSSPYYDNMTVIYEAGYTDVPKRLKQAIIRDVCFHYENRNDKAGELSEQAMALASSFKRVSTWLS
jgi:hypothetical protein